MVLLLLCDQKVTVGNWTWYTRRNGNERTRKRGCKKGDSPQFELRGDSFSDVVLILMNPSSSSSWSSASIVLKASKRDEDGGTVETEGQM